MGSNQSNLEKEKDNDLDYSSNSDQLQKLLVDFQDIKKRLNEITSKDTENLQLLKLKKDMEALGKMAKTILNKSKKSEETFKKKSDLNVTTQEIISSIKKKLEDTKKDLELLQETEKENIPQKNYETYSDSETSSSETSDKVEKNKRKHKGGGKSKKGFREAMKEKNERTNGENDQSSCHHNHSYIWIAASGRGGHIQRGGLNPRGGYYPRGGSYYPGGGGYYLRRGGYYPRGRGYYSRGGGYYSCGGRGGYYSGPF